MSEENENWKTSLACIISVVAFLFLTTACSNKGTDVPEGAKIEGESLIIVLEENPTTGFSWTYDEYDTAVLELVVDKYIPNESDPNVVGSGGIHHYEFKGLSEGETTLTLSISNPGKGRIQLKKPEHSISQLIRLGELKSYSDVTISNLMSQ